MIRTVVFLALVAYASAGLFGFGNDWKPGLSHTLPKFTGLPQSLAETAKFDFVKLADNAGIITGYEDLQLWVNPKKPCVALLINASGDIAGIQANLPVSGIVPYWKMEEQGTQLWTSDFTGTKTDYYRTQIILEPEGVKFEYESKIITLARNLENIHSDWKLQACVPLMGTHYYHNMTTSTTCDKPFPQVFGLYDTSPKQLIGIGFMFLGDCPNQGCYENPSTGAVKVIVRDGPECLYELVEKHKACTMHVYFINHPSLITCSL